MSVDVVVLLRKRTEPMSEKLGIGARFPRLTLAVGGGRTMTLPDDLKSAYAVILFYRGHW